MRASSPSRPTSNVGARALLAASLAAATWAPASEAQVIAPAGRTLFDRGVMVRTLVRFDALDAPSTGEATRRFSHVTSVVWGTHPHTHIGLELPVVRTERDGADGGTATTGTGDASVFARYDVLRRTVPGGYTRLAPELSVKLPTGGEFGTGSLDVTAGLVFSHVRDPDWWVADVQLTAPGSGDGGLRAGERRRFDLAYLRRLAPRAGIGSPMVLGVLELNAETVDEARIGGVVMPGTGGDLVALSPGVEVVVGRRLVLEGAISIPIYERLGRARLDPKHTVIVGMRWLF